MVNEQYKPVRHVATQVDAGKDQNSRDNDHVTPAFVVRVVVT
jgi:hypothetical protein